MTENVVISHRQERAVLFVVSLSLMTVVSAVSGLNVALPSLALATGATQSQLTWIVDAYTVVFAGLLLFAGAVGDRFGRKGILAAGLAIFGLGAGAAMFTESPQTLMLYRALMGIGAAGIMPTTLSVITTSFPPEDRPRAIGLWVGVAGGGAVLGTFVSGFLLEHFAWNSFFASNVVLAIVSLLGTLALVPDSRDPEAHRLDLAGAVLSLLAVGGIVFGIIEGSDRGWTDATTLTALGIGLFSAAAFVSWELRNDQPLLDPRLFRLRGFSAGTLNITTQFFAAFGFFFISLQYLQFVVGYSPLKAAFTLLPMPFVLIPTARNAPKLAARFGFRKVAPLGLVSMAAGFACISGLGTTFEPFTYFPGLLLFALGMGLAGTPATTAITASLPESKQGVASAVNDTSRELGSALGIAVLGSILASAYRDGVGPAVAMLPPQVAEAVRSSIAFTRSSRLAELGPAAEPLVAAAKQAFVDGVSGALVVGIVVLLVVAVVNFVRSPGANG